MRVAALVGGGAWPNPEQLIRERMSDVSDRIVEP
jgi:hypothetical protein